MAGLHSCVLERARTQIVPSLLLAAAAQACPEPLLPHQREMLAGSALGVMSPLGAEGAEAVMALASTTIRRLMTEAASPTPEGLLLASALAVALMYAGTDECPAAVRLAMELVFGRILEDDLALTNLHDAARSALAMALSCNQLQL